MLKRKVVVYETEYGPVKVKQSYYKGKIVNAKPEFDDCERLAKQHHVSMQEIQKSIFKKL
jgi:uncharacterized protein (DUF111 family)